MKYPDILKLLKDIQDDLLLRGEIGEDGRRVIDLSASLWDKLCDTIEYLEENRG